MTKKTKITYYVLLVIVCAVFLMACIPKLLGQPMVVSGFAQAGLPVWFMYCIGIGELLGVIGLWTRRFFRYAYEGLFIVLGGAIGTTIAFQSLTFALLPLVVAIILGIVVRLHNKYSGQIWAMKF